MFTTKKNASKIAKNTESKVTVYDIIYNKIVENKEKAEKEGRAFHWIKTWDTNGIPMSYTTQKPYKGVNLLFLEGGEYITFKQVQELQKKGQDISIKRGAKSDQVFFASQKELTEEEKQEVKAKRKEIHENAKKYITFLNEDDAEWEKANEEREEKGDWFWKYYRAFNVEEYIEGLEPHRKRESKEYKREECHQKADKMVKAYLKANKITFTEHGMDAETTQNPWGVSIIMPRKKNFITQYSYYSTLLHECIHSTRSFLKKDDLGKRDNKPHDKKTQKYSYEELVAQIGSNMLLNTIGILPEDEKFDGVNDYAYLNDWMAKLKDQKRMIVMAANDAQKAADYFLQVAEKELQENPAKYAEVEKVEGFYKIDISDFIKLENFLKEYNETEEEAGWEKFIKGGFLRQDNKGNLYDYMPPVKSFQEYKEELIKLYQIKEILKEYEEDNKELITDPDKIKLIREVKRTLANEKVKEYIFSEKEDAFIFFIENIKNIIDLYEEKEEEKIKTMFNFFEVADWDELYHLANMKAKGFLNLAYMFKEYWTKLKNIANTEQGWKLDQPVFWSESETKKYLSEEEYNKYKEAEKVAKKTKKQTFRKAKKQLTLF